MLDALQAAGGRGTHSTCTSPRACTCSPLTMGDRKQEVAGHRYILVMVWPAPHTSLHVRIMMKGNVQHATTVRPKAGYGHLMLRRRKATMHCQHQAYSLNYAADGCSTTGRQHVHDTSLGSWRPGAQPQLSAMYARSLHRAGRTHSKALTCQSPAHLHLAMEVRPTSSGCTVLQMIARGLSSIMTWCCAPRLAGGCLAQQGGIEFSLLSILQQRTAHHVDGQHEEWGA